VIPTLAALVLAAADGGSESDTLLEKLRPSVVQLVELSPAGEQRASGSGFIVSADGLLVTNHHVIEHIAVPHVKFFDKHEAELEGVLYDDDQQDLAVLKLKGSGYAPLKVQGEIPPDGSYVALLAAPLGLTWTFAEGVVAAFRPEGLPKELLGDDPLAGDKLPLLQLSLPSAQGTSGGPIVNRDGEVVAVVRAGFGEAGNYLLAIPARAVVERIAIAQHSQVKPMGQRRWWNLGISAAVFLGILGWGMFRTRRKRT
jgi:S1-C subfamily serine protease